MHHILRELDQGLMRITVDITYKIHRPVDEVYQAIVDPSLISKYFTSSASQLLKEGEQTTWDFADYGVSLVVEVNELIPNQKISFEWTGSGQLALVTMYLSDVDGQTQLRITEEDFAMDADGVKLALGQNQGWTDFVCALKAYLYTGINLRTGQHN